MRPTWTATSVSSPAPQWRAGRDRVAWDGRGAIHRTREPHGIGETAAREFIPQFARGDQRRIARIVEAAHPAQRQRFQYPESVIAHVMVEARVQAGRDRMPRRRATRRAAQPSGPSVAMYTASGAAPTSAW
jgi:hypothetical protein